MTDAVQEQKALQEFAQFLTELYDQGWQEGYAAAEGEFDAALTDAQEAGREVGRNEIIHEVTSLPNDIRLEIISALENRIHQEVRNT